MQERLRICAQVMCKNKAQTVKQNVHVLDISSLQYTRNAEGKSGDAFGLRLTKKQKVSNNSKIIIYSKY